MKILVNGEVKELTAWNTSARETEWTEDLLGNYENPSYKYDEEKEMHTMSQSDYEWWEDIITKMNSTLDMEDELSDEEREEYKNEIFPDADLETEVNAKFDWLEEKTKN